MKEKFSLKDHLFNPRKVNFIADKISLAYSKFNRKKFVNDVLEKFPESELKQRIAWIRTYLREHLPQDYSAAVNIILKSLPPPLDHTLSDGDFGDFIYEPFNNYIANYGIESENLKLSLSAIRETTKRFSAEDAIRYFINRHPEKTLSELLKWSKDKHYHVRRLCSEGTRPKLPWSQKINISLTAPLKILDNLFYDKTRFVTRSVANHVNDISKSNPELAIKLLKKWKASGKQNPAEMDFIIRHALRTLIKQGNKNALQLIGISDNPQIQITDFDCPKKVKLNSALEFSFSIKAKRDSRLLMDYILHFQNKAGSMNSKKVFKLKVLSIKAGDTANFSKSHMLKEMMTTRKLYPGKHKIELQLNGKIVKSAEFKLLR